MSELGIHCFQIKVKTQAVLTYWKYRWSDSL